MLKALMAAGMLAAGLAAPALADDAPGHPVKLHRYTAPLYAWNTNSYWLESADGVALIDAQLLSSDARYLAAAIKASGKPLKGVIITHGHVDHVSGLDVLRAEFGDFPIYGTEATKAAMPDIWAGAHRFFAMPNMFDEALSETMVLPDHMIRAGDRVEIAGISFEVFGGGPGEAADNIGVYAPALKAVFAGDMSYPFAHFYTGDGHPSGALAQARALRAAYDPALMVYSGHRDPAPVAQLDDQIAYLEFMIAETKAAMADPANLGDNGFLKREARRAVMAKILERYPHYDSFGFTAGEIVPGNIYGAEQEIKAATGS
ncbi:MAG: MBL fold metallo-hydrolase [Alphaproteobacteria bacterium]|nr:MAG: MBL fold metallo-hydrolase [Alphaproteobacteria bacterium]